MEVIDLRNEEFDIALAGKQDYIYKVVSADKTGVADSTATIQAALDYVGGLTNGGTVFIPNGIYKVTNTLHLSSNTTLIGESRDKTILRTTGVSFPGYTHAGGNTSNAVITMMGVSNSVVRSITVDNNTNGTSVNGITIEPSGLSGIAMSGYSDKCIIEDCNILGSIFHNYLIWNQGGTNTKILNNFVNGNSNTPTGSVDQVGIEVYGGNNVLVSGNTAVNCHNIAIGIGSPLGRTGDVATTSNVIVCNNYTKNCWNSISVFGSYDGVSVLLPTKNVNIYGNTITDIVNYGYHLYSPNTGTVASGYKLSNINFHSNIIEGGASNITYSIYVQLPSVEDYYRNIKIENNQIAGINTASSGHIRFLNANNVEFCNNTVANSAKAVMMVIQSQNTKITGNFFNFYTGKCIEIQGSTRIKCSDNTFQNGTTNTAITIHVSSASYYCEFVNNIFNTLNNFNHISDQNVSSNYTRITGNRLNYINTTNVPFIATGTNVNYGVTAAVPNLATTINVAYANGRGIPATQTTTGLVVTQIAGPVTAFKITHTAAGFTITLGTASDGTTQFYWERYE